MKSKNRQVVASLAAVFACMALSSCGHDFNQLIKEGDDNKEKVKLVDAEANYAQALKQAESKHNKQQMLTATLKLAELKRLENKNNDSIALYEKIIVLADGIPSEGATRKAASHNEIAKLSMIQNDKDTAIKHLQESLDILSEAAKDDSIEAAEAHSQMGMLLSDQKDFERADKHLRKAVAAYEANKNADFGALSRTMFALANNCRLSGNDDEATEIEDRARKVNVGGVTSVTTDAYTKFNQ